MKITRPGKKEERMRQDKVWIDEEVQLQSPESWCTIAT